MYTVSENKMVKLTHNPFQKVESFSMTDRPNNRLKRSTNSTLSSTGMPVDNSDRTLSIVLGVLLIAVGGMVLYNAYKKSKSKSSLGFGFAL